MWPFKRKAQPRSTVRLTDEEHARVQREFDAFKKPNGEVFVVRADLKEEFDREVTARALYYYAEDQLQRSGFDSYKDKKEALISTARAALLKATILSSLPMYKYYLARSAKREGHSSEAKNLFRAFIEEARRFQPSQLQELGSVAFSDSLKSAIEDAIEQSAN